MASIKISLTEHECSLIDTLLEQFKDNDGEFDKEQNVNEKSNWWGCAEKIQQKIRNNLIKKEMGNKKIPAPASYTVTIQEDKQDKLLICKNDCRFFKDNQCTKEDAVINYYGYDEDEFYTYFEKYQNSNADECLTFETIKSFKVIEFNGKIVKVGISSCGETCFTEYTITNLAYFVHLYGIESFSGMELLGDDAMRQIIR